jgi:hypothetical protein
MSLVRMYLTSVLPRVHLSSFNKQAFSGKPFEEHRKPRLLMFVYCIGYALPHSSHNTKKYSAVIKPFQSTFTVTMLSTPSSNAPCSSTPMRSFESQIPYASQTPGLPYEIPSQDQSNWMESPPVIRCESNGSFSVNSGSESLDSNAAAGFAFPGRLHKMLRGVEAEGLSHIVSWQPHGRCFVVHKPKEFVRDILHK